ncbi:MAG: hypothetical protein V8T10_01335 [Merdibacter sp.]
MVADNVTVLRRGKKIATLDVSKTTKEEMSELMVGRKVSFEVEKSEKQPGEAILEVETSS